MNIRKIFLLGILILVFGFGGLFFYNFFIDVDKTVENVEKKEEKVILSEYVMTTDEVKLYKLSDDDYIVAGGIGKEELLNISETDNNYYKVKNIDGNYFVKSDNLIDTKEEFIYDERYKNYIVFNNNVVTEDKTSFYDKEGKLVYTFNQGMDLAIIIKDNDRYGVEFGDRLLFVKDSDVKVVNSNNTDLDNTKGIGVLNYHFFYDEDISGEKSKCNQVICASKSQFKMHLDYIKDNNFFTPTMEELEMYIDGKIRLPKSVIITIDDGWRAELGIKMLTEYQLNATLFVVTSWYNPDDFKTDYVEVHSHSHNLHNSGDCNVGQGGGIQCLSEDTILNDLKVSSEKLHGSKVFCYPFYEYNNYSISMLKKAGYRMAFAGEKAGSDNLVKVGSDKYSLPRFIVVNYTNMRDFKNYLNGWY